jgi:hypothetical protein
MRHGPRSVHCFDVKLFNHRSQASLHPDSTWMDDNPQDDKYAGCCEKDYGVEEDTGRSYSACLREISRKKKKKIKNV